MSHAPYSKTLVAAAVLALTSGCATTTADGPGHGGGLADGIARAGQKTVGFGQTVWQRTGFLLGLHDDPGVPLPGAAPEGAAAPEAVAAAGSAVRAAPAPSPVPVAKLPLHLDEVDLAMMEPDPVMPGEALAPAGPGALPGDALGDADLLVGADPLDALEVLPFEDPAPGADPAVAAASPDPLDPLGLDRAPAPAAVASAAPTAAPVPVEAPALAAAQPAPSRSAPDEAPGTPVAVVAAEDLEHRVGESETLWDIAKKTTGDATNWHTLADVNDLGPGASVYPGQTLTIPADMVRPELAGAAPAAVPAEPAPAEAVAAAEPPAGRLAIPAGPSPVATPVDEPTDGAEGFELAAGETLWDFAKRTTGDATNWQAIATQNGFDEARAVAVRAGERIFVPNDLVKARDAAGTPAPVAAAEVPAPASPEPAAEPVRVAAAEPEAAEPEDVFVPIPDAAEGDADARGIDATVDASAQALAGANGAGAPEGDAPDAERDIRIIEATYTGGDGADPAGVPAAPGLEDVTISGTYYPKAIYSDADFSAGLLMRVSPGTSLRVTGVDGTWYEVETERGAGWVHQRDVQ